MAGDGLDARGGGRQVTELGIGRSPENHGKLRLFETCLLRAPPMQTGGFSTPKKHASYSFFAKKVRLILLSVAVTGSLISGISKAEKPEEKSGKSPLTLEEERDELLKKRPDFFKMFDALTFEYSREGREPTSYNYSLYVPEGVSKDNKRPLLIWLHGFGACGDKNIEHIPKLDRLIFFPPYEKKDYPFFLLAVQCSKQNCIWVSSTGENDDMLEVVMEILDRTVQDYAVDTNRISVTGLSSGGAGTWEIARRYPERFSAIAPIASFYREAPGFERVAEVPVWAFHSISDEDAPLEVVRRNIDALDNAGGFARLTVVNLDNAHTPHNAWTDAFGDYELLEWLLSQEKGQGTMATTFAWLWLNDITWPYVWPRLVSVSVALLVLMAMRREIKQKKKTVCRPRFI